MKKVCGFGLVELLVVVAVIAVLAAATVPDFLEAQTRAKVSRAKSDLATVAAALESYVIDYSAYPYDGYTLLGPGIPAYNYWCLGKMLSTPTAYLTTVDYVDPFRESGGTHWQGDNLRYTNVQSTWGLHFSALTSRVSESSLLDETMMEFGGWRLVAVGPDGLFGPYGWGGISGYPAGGLMQPYDPTNGTVSAGDITQTQLSSTGYLNVN